MMTAYDHLLAVVSSEPQTMKQIDDRIAARRCGRRYHEGTVNRMIHRAISDQLIRRERSKTNGVGWCYLYQEATPQPAMTVKENDDE
jgi:predicted transcriptional regulator